MPQPIETLEWEDAVLPYGEERRASTRYPANVRVRCMPVKSGGIALTETVPAWTAQVRNLSCHGIALLLAHAPAHGALLEIELVRKDGTFIRTLLARVIHHEPESSKAFVVGCAFVTELEDKDLQAFKASAVHPAAPDSRRWTRYPCNVETIFYTRDTAPGERRSGRILNISAGGIGLLLRCQFSEGTLLYFELPNLANPRVLVRVVRVIEHGDSWFLGCEFVDHLREDDLQSMLR